MKHVFFSAVFCIFQRVNCRGVVIFHIFKKETFLHMRRKYTYLNRNWPNIMKLPIIVFVGNAINKNRVAIVLNGYHNVIHFSIIGIFILVYTLSITSLEIFRLAYILSDSTSQEHVHIDLFLASVPILNTLKMPGNQKASGVFRGIK